MFILVALASIFATGSVAPLVNCRLDATNGYWKGSCGPLVGQNPLLVLARANSVLTGAWRRDVKPTSVWLGEITDSGHPNARLELEIYKQSGVLRTGAGWFLVSHFTSGSALQFQLDTTRAVPPSDLDRQIAQRAAAILSSASVWNRADNRNCSMMDTTWSIYCALERASIEVTGGFNHRRPALETVRQVVEERTVGRKYEHRLMDYNNDPTTHLNDVRSVFVEALARMNR